LIELGISTFPPIPLYFVIVQFSPDVVYVQVSTGVAEAGMLISVADITILAESSIDKNFFIISVLRFLNLITDIV
jgi:hypothetical protein